jgi:hypothetical protein
MMLATVMTSIPLAVLILLFSRDRNAATNASAMREPVESIISGTRCA